MKADLLKAALASLAVASVFWFTAFQLFFGNVEAFYSLLKESVIGVSAFAVLIFAFFFIVQLLFLGRKAFLWVNVTVLLVAALWWVQANVLLWKTDMFGESQTRIHLVLVERNCGPMAYITEFVVYALVIFLFYRFHAFLSRNTARCVFVLVCAQLLVLLPSATAYRESLSLHKRMSFHDEEKFVFSDRGNIIFFIIDSYGENFFGKVLAAHPDIAENELRDFVHFPRFLSPAPYTGRALPTLMTGEAALETKKDMFLAGYEYTPAVKKMYEDSPFWNSLPSSGYRINVFPLIPQVFPAETTQIANLAFRDPHDVNPSRVLTDRLVTVTFYRMAPSIFKQCVFHLSETFTWGLYALYCGDPIFVEGEKGDPKDRKYADEFYPQAEKRVTVDHRKRFMLYHLLGTHDEPELAEIHLRSFGGFLELLRKNGVYDNSYIVVLGDHGHHDIAEYEHNPILLIKKPGQTFDRMRENDEIVLMRDIAPTVADDLEMVKSKDVYSLWHFSPAQKEERRQWWNRLMGDAKP